MLSPDHLCRVSSSKCSCCSNSTAPHQACDGGVVGDEADNTVTNLDFFMDLLQQVGAPDLSPVVFDEVAEHQHIDLASCISAAALGKRSASKATRRPGLTQSPQRSSGSPPIAGGGVHVLLSLLLRISLEALGYTAEACVQCGPKVFTMCPLHCDASRCFPVIGFDWAWGNLHGRQSSPA